MGLKALLLLLLPFTLQAQFNTCAQAVANQVSLPYAQTNTTCAYTNTNTLVSVCVVSSLSSYVSANDVFYAFTSTTNQTITLSMWNILGNNPNWGYYNVMVYAGCPTTTNCVTSFADYTLVNAFTIQFEALAGQLYVIVLDGWNITAAGFSSCYSYNISITGTAIPINIGCANDGFASGLSGWYGTVGRVNMGAIGAQTPFYYSHGPMVAGPRHLITSGLTDPCIGAISSPLGGNFLRLGRNITNREANRISKKLNVTQGSSMFTYAFLPVLQEPGHTSREQPFFEALFTTPNGSVIQCSQYIVAAAQGLSGYINGTCPNVIYRPWSLVSVDLTDFIGQTITVQFTSGGCSQGAHWGYVYLDYQCSQSPFVETNYSICIGSCLTLPQPLGYASYVWNPSQTVCPTNDINPTLNLVSANGCIRTINFDVDVKPLPVVNINSN